MRTAETAALHTAGNMHMRATASSVQRRTPATTDNEPSWLFTCVALLGIAALSSAAASSLLPEFGDVLDGGSSVSGLGGPLLGVAGVFSAIYGLAALAYCLTALRHGKLIRTEFLIPVLAIAAGIHLIGLLLGLWRMPAEERTFDVTLAAMLVLELSATAVLGWARNAPLRRTANQSSSAAAVSSGAAGAPGSSAALAAVKPRSAAAVVGTFFAISLFVAGLTTVGMAASTAGELAVPHSGHSDSGPGDSGHDTNVVPENIQQLKDQGHHH